jgi:hypothetical protein
MLLLKANSVKQCQRQYRQKPCMKCNEIHIVCIAFLLYVFISLEVSKVKLKMKKREATKIIDNSWLPVLKFPLIMNEKKKGEKYEKKQTMEI